MKHSMKRKWTVATAAALLVVMALPATGGAQTPPGKGLFEFPFPLDCDGVTVTATVTQGELVASAALGPGWLSDIGQVVPRSLTIFDANNNVIFENTVGKKTAKALETIICTGPAFTPTGEMGNGVFEFVLLP